MNMNKCGFILKVLGAFIIVSLSGNAFADYYVVYPTPCCGTPPPVVYKKKCYTKKHYKKHYVKKKRVHRPVSPVITVYYINNNPCGGFGCTQPVMPTTSCCGYQVFSGTTVKHSDYYYMQEMSEQDPNMDGNTLDNDIYY